MGQRIDLHHLICDKIGSIAHMVWEIPENELVGHTLFDVIRKEAPKHVYYQPPASVKLSYPCVVYRLEDMPAFHADNFPYHWDHSYQITVIDRDPESEIREKIAEIRSCRFVNSFVADNLNHYVFRVYY